jgi:DNA-binding transcriptional ArsR family regulator
MNERELEKVLKALANRRRIAIVKFIKKSKSGSASVGQVADAIKLSFKATSKHLMILGNAGILEKEQISLTVLYSISKERNHVVARIISLV